MREPGREEELLSDPAALAEVRSRYRGGADLVDVLRWRIDPAALGADGLRSPTARAADLAPLIYGRADTPEGAQRRDPAAAEAEALSTGWAADVAALEAALAAHAAAAEGSPGRVPGAALGAAPATAPADLRPRRAVDRRRPALLIGASAVAVALLVGTVVLLQPRASEESAALPSSTPLPTPVPSTPKPTRTVVPASPPPPPVMVTPPPEEVDLRPDYYDNDIMSVLQVPINGGPIDNANGVADVDDYGVPLSYVVASGDVFELIAKRFDLGTTDLASINAVRRENPTELFVGDTINLGATTILLIGDQNGVVYNFTDRLPEPHLPQD